MTQVYNIPQQQKTSRYLRNSPFYMSSNPHTENDIDEKVEERRTAKQTPSTFNDHGLLSQPVADYILTQQMGSLSSEHPLKSSLAPITSQTNHIFKHAEESYHKLDDPNGCSFDDLDYSSIKDLVDVSFTNTSITETKPIVEEAKISDVSNDDNDIHDTS